MVTGRPLALMAVAAAVAVTVGCSATPPMAMDGLVWGPCDSSVNPTTAGIAPDRLPRLTITCSLVDVPLDPLTTATSTPTTRGGTITIRLVRVHHGPMEKAKEPLLLIAGGPGGSGVDNALYAAGYLPQATLDAFDLVGFDPRGVGRSGPIHCPKQEPLSRPIADLTTDAGYSSVADPYREHVERCIAALDGNAGHYGTTATAHDIDAIRAALGEEKLTAVGWSYGAKLGGEYVRLFPSHVRAIVLDAPTDPTVPWIITSERQVAGFEDTFDAFVDWCATHLVCDALGDVRASTARLVERADADPIRSGRPQGDLPATGVDVLDGVTAALYDDARWPDLAEALAEAASGDSGSLREQAASVRGEVDADTNFQDALMVINCTDSAPGPTEEEIRSAAARFAKKYPLFGQWGAPQMMACTPWTAPRHTLHAPVAPSAPTILVVGTVHDPATPYQGAVSMAASLGHARLLTWEGVGHGAFGRDDCTGEHVSRYLVDLTVPPEGTRCPP